MTFPLKVGVTGGIGSGKSLVCKILQTMGYPVFFSDSAAKNCMQNDTGLKNDLVLLVGEQAYEVNGELNRPYLADIIFKQPSILQEINAKVHPRVRQAFEDFVQQNSTASCVFNEAAILFETGSYKNFDKTILVTAPVDMRIQRVMLRDLISKEKVVHRLKNQWEDAQKIPLADFVITNDEVSPLTPQIERIVSQINKKGCP